MVIRKFNSKRRIQTAPATPSGYERFKEIAQYAKYVGSPFHKRNPADFGLAPPSAPRQGKTLCDGAVNCHQDAQRFLIEGLNKGLVSEQMRNGWPQNVWAVTESGIALEAQLDNEEKGTYHGYPMTNADPLCEEVIERWKST